MGDSLTTIVGILLAAILMFIFPMMAISERNDDVSQLSVQTAVSEFVHTAVTTGKITEAEYDKLISKLYATKNTYNVEMELQVQDKNPGKKGDERVAGENIYYSIYTSQIMDKLDKNGKVIMKDGDQLTVKASNTNNTISQMLKNFFYSLSGNDTYSIVGSQTGMVTANGNANT